ncbi:MAG: hypothetical protein KAS78_04050 [Candidatus Pacebacteria bacterium]|nr:hypothetical protein [Candidatus Paceibacterota bacterium]
MEKEKIAEEVQVGYDNKETKPKKSLINKKFMIRLIVVSSIVIFLMLIYAATKFDEKSHAYADIAIPAIVASWNSQELISRASPEFIKSNSPEKVELMFDHHSNKLGRVKEYKGSQGGSEMLFGLGWLCQQGFLCLTITAEYTAEAVFEKGSAEIEIEMLLRNNRWEIIHLAVRS